MRTVAELQRLLRPKVEAGESGTAKIAAVIHRLREQKYLDDAAYSATYTRLRQENERFGKRRVAQDLARKGIDSGLIASSIQQNYKDIDEEALARQHLERKRVNPPANEKEAARVVRLLLRAGFSTGVIFKVLKEWRSSDETLAALDSIESEDPNQP